MKISKLHIFISIIFLTTISLVAFFDVNRVDTVYVGQFIVLLAAFFFIENNRLLKLSIGSLILADAIYYALVYKFEFSTDSMHVVLCTSSLYGFSFAMFSWLLLKKNLLKIGRLAKNWLELPAIIFFSLIAVVYILIPGVNKFTSQGVDFTLLSHAITFLCSLPMVLICYIHLSNSISIKDQFIFLGFFVLGILDIGIQLETIRYGNLSFSFYDIIWFCAITLISFFVSDFSKACELIEKKSVVNLTKKIFFLAALIPIALFGFLLNSTESQSPMYFIFLLISIFIFGILCANLIQIGIDRINNELSKVYRSEAEIDLVRVLEGSPVEFQNSLFEACKTVIEKDMSGIQNERRQLLELSAVYKRMAHDISSPISVLQLLTSTTGNLDDERKQLIQAATQRVRSIADDILEKNLTNNKIENTKLPQMTYSELFKLVTEIVMEKNIEFGSQIVECKLDIKLNNNKMIYASGSELSRIISNLINNAMASEVIGKDRAIALFVEERNAHLLINISDNGKGFSEEILENRMQAPMSLGAKRGHGIGLFSANVVIRRWSGAMSLFNQGGANVRIELRICEPPSISVLNTLN